jgi:hypothetical protein
MRDHRSLTASGPELVPRMLLCRRDPVCGNLQTGYFVLGHLFDFRDTHYCARALRVRAAFLAEADRWAGLRFRAAERACRESAFFDAAARPSRLSAFSAACERLRDGLAAPPRSAFLRSCFAFRRVSSGTRPFAGTGSFTPARRALERPMAIACLVERAPCSPFPPECLQRCLRTLARRFGASAALCFLEILLCLSSGFLFSFSAFSI